MQTLILGDSYDPTIDLVVKRLSPEACFRVNVDLLDQYEISRSPTEFSITDPTGRSATSATVSKCWWRKPYVDELTLAAMTPLEVYSYREAQYMLLDLHGLCRDEGKAVLTDPIADRAVGKMRQLRIASRSFRIPGTLLRGSRSPVEPAFSPAIVKSLTGSIIDGNRVFWTRRIPRGARLDRGRLWLIQEEVDATHDVTVAMVGTAVFAFSLDRSLLAEPDWRKVGSEMRWEPVDLSPQESGGLREFMTDCGFKFARIDFLRSASGELVFLEANATGQWAWLDLDGRSGLLDAVCRELDPSSTGTTTLSP